MLKNAEWTAARDLLLERVLPAAVEAVPLSSCGGRILGFDLNAGEDIPSFDRSAYDGYALRASDTADASPEKPVTLQVTETVPAGRCPSLPVNPGTAARLMTGAPVPDGADCVIMYEKTVFTPETVTLTQPLHSGDNIVKRGEDVKAGTPLASRGTVIDAGLAGTLAAQGIAEVPVYRLPVIGLISTGPELVEAGTVPAPGQIRDSNRACFTALLRREGCRVRDLGQAGDDAEAIARLIREAVAGCDAVILTGGVSAGDWDVTPEAMSLAGADILLRGIRMKPGMACAYGVADGKLILGLSGNPASSLTNFCACVLPAVRKLCGRRDPLPGFFRAALIHSFPKKSPSARFLRGRLVLDDGTVRFEAAASQGNAVLSSAIGCSAFLLIPAGSGPVAAGALLDGFFYD